MTETRPDATTVQVLAAPAGTAAGAVRDGDLWRQRRPDPATAGPALYNLARTGLTPEHFAIIGVDIAERSAEDWRGSLREMLQSFVGNPNSENRLDAIDDAV